MKKLLLASIYVIFSLHSLFGQYSDKGWSFQGYAIDGDNKAIALSGVDVKFTIYGTVGGTTHTYVEVHTLTTDAFGIFSATIGSGTKDNGASNKSFEELNFDNFDFKLRVDVKENSAANYVNISDKTLEAVPYARSAANGVPVGTVVAFAGPESAIPNGWLLCDGTAYNASTNLVYAQLFAAIGTTWGGTGNTDFRVPDFRGQFLRGLNVETTGLDANRTLGSHQTDDILSHNHGINDPGHNHIHSGNSAWQNLVAYTNTGTTTATDNSAGEFNIQDARPLSASTTGITIQHTGGTETRPHNYAVNYIIKY